MEALAAAIPVASSSDWPADLLEELDGDGIIMSSSGIMTRRPRRGLPARVAGAVVRGVLTFVFAAAGAVLGAVTGALIGLATESGLVRGAGVGAISGAVVSMEVVDSSVAIWRSHESGIWSVLYVLDVIWSLLTGRLVREKVDPAVQSAVESQMNAAGPSFGEPPITLADMMLFDATSPATTTRGLPAAAIDALPSTTYNYAENEERAGCTVCLQELQAGETARRLPRCGHTFHLPCIDAWLLRHASCPLCRRAVEAVTIITTRARVASVVVG